MHKPMSFQAQDYALHRMIGRTSTGTQAGTTRDVQAVFSNSDRLHVDMHWLHSTYIAYISAAPSTQHEPLRA